MFKIISELLCSAEWRPCKENDLMCCCDAITSYCHSSVDITNGAESQRQEQKCRVLLPQTQENNVYDKKFFFTNWNC